MARKEIRKKSVSGAGVEKSVRATVRYLRISAQKLNSVAREVRNLSLPEAKRVLQFLPKKAAVLLLKLLNSAAASAALKSMKVEDLYVRRLEIGPGPSLKRGRAVSRGSYHPIRKKTSYVNVELAEVIHGTKS